MKKIAFSITFLLVISTLSYSQSSRWRASRSVKWLNISAIAGYGTSLYMNDNLRNDNNINTNTMTPSLNVGGKFGITFGDHISTSFEMTYSEFGQNFSINVYPNYSIDKKIISTDYALMLRYTGYSGLYIELGPKFAKLKSATASDSRDTIVENQIDYYSKDYVFLSGGVGLAPIRLERFEVFLGLRFNYGMGDFIPGGVFTQEEYLINYRDRVDTRAFTLQLKLEINYIFGFWGNARCGRGRLMLFQ